MAALGAPRRSPRAAEAVGKYEKIGLARLLENRMYVLQQLSCLGHVGALLTPSVSRHARLGRASIRLSPEYM